MGIGTAANAKKDGLIVYKDGTLGVNTLSAAPAVATNRLYALNNQLMYNGAMIGEASQLQKLTQNGKTGYRLLGVNVANYGNIGADAIDLSMSLSASTTRGATGQYGIAIGNNTTASGFGATSIGGSTISSGLGSVAIGSMNTASGNFSLALGNETIATGHYATTTGYYTKALGSISTAMGHLTEAKSYAEVVFGSFNTDYTPVNATAYDAADRAFVIGIGSSEADRKDGFVLFKSGNAVFGNGNGSQKGRVYIENGLNAFVTPFTYLSNTQNPPVGTYNGSGTTEVGLYSEARILATEFNAFSDKRIKDVVGQSNIQQDLNTLAQIKITDYTMKDKIQYGNKSYKKVIAQELKTIYPQAVSLSSSFIPNIYKVAAVQEGWVNLQTDVVKGDKIRIVTATGQQEIIVEAVAENRFKINLPNAERVFFFGKEVSDFHVVDYEALTTLNISATQALLTEIQQLKAQNVALKSQVESLNQLKAEVQQIKNLLQADKMSLTKQ